MEKIIAACGNDCAACPRYVAHPYEKTDEELRHIAIDGFFLAIGHHPNTDLFKDYVARDAEGYIITDGASTQCFSLPFREGYGVGLPGIFAAGDCADPHYRQAIVAAGSGAKAAIEADKYIKSL